ncbi:hypothetical protein EJ08DRAFT_644563 [Tothia fuscella]|uniref:Uncharacterized protein n=1 Tax=Tothia fuscella TaxID=1048955 RepID=A0A9P4U4U5_9PEZI|nr:hypothetical protein EJ08DRAFT_644563 [Tothia fuscella]
MRYLHHSSSSGQPCGPDLRLVVSAKVEALIHHMHPRLVRAFTRRDKGFKFIMKRLHNLEVMLS